MILKLRFYFASFCLLAFMVLVLFVHHYLRPHIHEEGKRFGRLQTEQNFSFATHSALYNFNLTNAPLALYIPPTNKTGQSQNISNLSASSSSTSTLPLASTSTVTDRLIKLNWTSFRGSRDTYHLFSAYFDGRSSSELKRPAVIVMGYVNRKTPTIKVYCSFRYPNNSTSCSVKPATQRHASACWDLKREALPFHYICELDNLEELPVTVRLSTSQNCEQEKSSAELLVRNRRIDSPSEKAPKKFGICIGGPLVQEESYDLFRSVTEFVEMGQMMGAELIVFYVNEAQVDTKLLHHLWKNYPDTVRTIGWRKFEKWVPFHYYGQLLMISDCFYRHMYEVEYIAMIDVDEMIIPFQHTNWHDMMSSLDTSTNISSFYFQNAFFIPEKEHKEQPVLANCSKTATPKYFTNTKRIKCFPGYDYRPKLISRPKYVYEPSVHWNCAQVQGHSHSVRVPPETALLGHYRATIPKDCQNKPTVLDDRVKKYMDQLTKRICLKENN